MTNVVMQRANVFLDCVLGGRSVVTIHSHQFVMDTCILNGDYYYMTSQNKSSTIQVEQAYPKYNLKIDFYCTTFLTSFVTLIPHNS